MIKVLNMKFFDGICDGIKFVRIDRISKWGNKFRIGKDGDRDMVIKKYKVWAWNEYCKNEVFKMEFDKVFVNNDKLEGVVCWCKPHPCHGDVLVKMIDYLRRKK